MKTILFIEDEAALQRTVKEMLEKEGYEVLSAFDGESGLKVAKERLPQLVLLDLILPIKNGFEVLKELREHHATRDIPVVILSVSEESQDIQQTVELGATAYLIKTNYSLNEVIGKIKNIIEG